MGNMMLDRFVFDFTDFPPRAVTKGFVRGKASIRPCVSDYAIIHKVVEGDVL